MSSNQNEQYYFMPITIKLWQLKGLSFLISLDFFEVLHTMVYKISKLILKLPDIVFHFQNIIL